MKRTLILSKIALSAWLVIVPAGLSFAQSGGGSAGGGTSGGGGISAGAGAAQGGGDGTGVGAAGLGSGNAGPTTGVGGGVGGQFGGVSGGGVGGRFRGVSGGGAGGRYSQGSSSTNFNNAGAADRLRGQGIDQAGNGENGIFSGNSTNTNATGRVGTGNGNQFDRYNGGATNRVGGNSNYSGDGSVRDARDRLRSQAERLNDNDDFQSDPYQSRQYANQPQTYERRRDARERRQYQTDRALDAAATSQQNGDQPNFTGGYDDRYYSREDAFYSSRYNDHNFRNDRRRDYGATTGGVYGNGAGGTTVIVDDGYGYSSGAVVDGAYVNDNGVYVGPGLGTQYYPDRRYTSGRRDAVRAPPRGRNLAVDRMNTNDPSLRDRGAGNIDQLPSGGARKQSMDRAANFVDANLGREADEKLDEEFPEGTGVQAGRRVDARLDPRAR